MLAGIPQMILDVIFPCWFKTPTARNKKASAFLPRTRNQPKVTL